MLSTSPSSLKHAINNPLAIISGNAQLLQDIIRKKEYRSELVKPLQDIEEACERIAALLDRLDTPGIPASMMWEEEAGHELTSYTTRLPR